MCACDVAFCVVIKEQLQQATQEGGGCIKQLEAAAVSMGAECLPMGLWWLVI